MCWIQSEWTMHGQTYTTITAKVYKMRPFEPLFPSYGFLMIKENVYSVQLECPCSWSAACIGLFVTVTVTSKTAGSLCVANLRHFVCSVSNVKLVQCLSTLNAEMVDTCLTFGWTQGSECAAHLVYKKIFSTLSISVLTLCRP